MQYITIRRARTWRWARMRPWVARSSAPVSLSPSQSCPGCTTNTSGYDFRKGQDIPKANGGTRPLGIPTVADRIAQEVGRRYLELLLEPLFHADSYGYRPGRSAIDAIRTARRRCCRADWVVDLEIQRFFDSIDHETFAQGAPKTHGLPMGAALCRALVKGLGAVGGWKAGASHGRNAARWRRGATAGEPVSSLCFRRLDS